MISSVRLAHDMGPIVLEAQTLAALGKDRREGRVVQMVAVDQRTVQIEEQRERHARARRGLATLAAA